MPNRIRQMRTVLHVADLAASVEFYEYALGCRRLSSWDEDGNSGVLLEVADGRIIELLASQTAPPVPPAGVELVVVVDDVDAWHSRTESLGLKIADGLTDQAWGRSFEMRDPDGVPVRVAQVVTVDSSRTS
jgi:catechol 2,3-dioxygenase-like lactoylglutathione lyase family enzyme